MVGRLSFVGGFSGRRVVVFFSWRSSLGLLGLSRGALGTRCVAGMSFAVDGLLAAACRAAGLFVVCQLGFAVAQAGLEVVALAVGGVEGFDLVSWAVQTLADRGPYRADFGEVCFQAIYLEEEILLD